MKSFKNLLSHWQQVIHIPSIEYRTKELLKVPFNFDGKDKDGDRNDTESVKAWAIPFNENQYYKIRITSDEKNDKTHDKTYTKNDMKIKDLITKDLYLSELSGD